MYDWKDNLNKKTNRELFELFSETNRINLKPQLYVGNILFDRGYKVDALIQVKSELIKSIEVTFAKKYSLDPKKIAQRTVSTELFLRLLSACAVFFIFYLRSESNTDILNITLNTKVMAYILGILSFLPLLWIKKTIRKATEKAHQKQAEKDKSIAVINTVLKF